MSMRNRYQNQSLSSPVRQKNKGKKVRLLRDVPVGGTGILHQGEECLVEHEFSGGVSVRTSVSSGTVVLHDGSFVVI